MSIIIQGMEIPKYKSIRVCINQDGTVVIAEPWRAGEVIGIAKELPPHGDLIDKKTVSENLVSVLNKKNPPFFYPDWNDAVGAIYITPTIIEAEEVYDQYTDTAGNLHWTGTRSGAHTVKVREKNEQI